jgi:pimeloyl-ACP methyl ester carboxylesterase
MLDKEGYEAFATNLFRQMFFTPSALADSIVERAVRQSREFGPALWPSMGRWDASQMEAALEAVRVPMLAIQTTTRDAQLRRSPLKRGDTSPWLELLRQKVSQARIEIIPDTGHFPQIEAAEEVNRLIADFLAARR